MKKVLKANGTFDLRAVVFSHGWSDLPPFYVQNEEGKVKVALRNRGKPITVLVKPKENGMEVESPLWSNEIEKTIRWMFKLDEPMNEFYQVAKNHQRPWIEEKKMGRLLRSETVFEDLTKLVLTTNCSWSFTRIMTERLAQKLGEKTKDKHNLFPTAEVMARKNEKYYREVIRAGYRSPSLVKLSRMFSKGLVNVKSWLDPKVPFEQVRKDILSLPGAGPYVADNLLRFLGRYERLGLDSWARKKLKTEWNMKKNPSDKTIEKKYKVFGKNQGLVLWCDLTRDWFEGKDFSSWIRTGERI